MIKLTEVTIIGAGYVGCTLALLLKRAGLDVTILEKAAENSSISDSRHFGIARETRILLQDLGLWTTLQPQTVEIATMQIDTTEKTLLRLGDSDHIIGRMLPAALLHKTLRQALKSAEVPIAFESHCTEFIAQPNHVEISTNKGALMTTPLLIAADGMHSGTRKLARIDLEVRDYHQNAQQWQIIHTQPHENQAFEVLLPHGPYVVLPTQEPNSSKLIWCISNKNPEPCEADLIDLFPPQLGEVEMLESLGSYPLTFQRAKACHQNRVVLIGDAYQRVHPVAAQGLNIGLRDAQALATMIIEAKHLGLDMGSAALLKQFAENRRLDRRTVYGLTDFLGDKAGKPALQKSLGMLSEVFATKSAKRIIRKAFHGE